jgi:hypothetical protein
MAKRIGKVIPRQEVFVHEGAIQANAANTNTIQITNVVGSEATPPAAGIDPLCSVREVELPEIRDDVDIVFHQPSEEYDANPKICKFKAKRADDHEYIVDVDFLVHVIRVIVENHNTLTPIDVEEMLSGFGEVSVKTQQQTYMTRDVEPGCCGMSATQKEHVMTVIKSVALNGLNLAKHIPDMLSFLTKIGVSIL